MEAENVYAYIADENDEEKRIFRTAKRTKGVVNDPNSPYDQYVYVEMIFTGYTYNSSGVPTHVATVKIYNIVAAGTFFDPDSTTVTYTETAL